MKNFRKIVFGSPLRVVLVSNSFVVAWGQRLEQILIIHPDQDKESVEVDFVKFRNPDEFWSDLQIYYPSEWKELNSRSSSTHEKLGNFANFKKLK